MRLIRTYGFGPTREDAIENARRRLALKIARIGLVIMLAAILGASPATAADKSRAVVSRVVAPTLYEMVVDGKPAKVRLIGVASPGILQMMGASLGRNGGEQKTKGWHGRAKEAVSGMMPSGTAVTLEFDPFKRNWKGKNEYLMAYVWLPGGKMLNERIVRDGWGEASVRETDKWRSDYVKILKESEREARDARRGFWADARPKNAIQ